MPVIRVPDDVFRRLQHLATPLVDTPASVIEKLLTSYESHTGTALTRGANSDPQTSPVPLPGTGQAFETYENKNNPHVTIHRVGCSQLRKRGGVHRHGQGSYAAHGTLADARRHATQTGLPIKVCSFCSPTRSGPSARSRKVATR